MFKKWWREAEVTHVVGKDITRFHAVYWPAFLLSAGLPLPKRILVHGFITAGGQKISKSLGNAVSPFDYIAAYGCDALRYYLLREIPTLDDGSFTAEQFAARYQADLANGIGNLVQRVTTMVAKYLNGGYPPRPSGTPPGEGISRQKSPLGKGAGVGHEGGARKGLQAQVDACMEQYQIDQALEAIWDKISVCDKRVDVEKPWVLAKESAKREILEKLLSDLIADLEDIGKALTPFLPETAGRILEIVNAQRILPPSKPLFPRK